MELFFLFIFVLIFIALVLLVLSSNKSGTTVGSIRRVKVEVSALKDTLQENFNQLVSGSTKGTIEELQMQISLIRKDLNLIKKSINKLPGRTYYWHFTYQEKEYCVRNEKWPTAYRIFFNYLVEALDDINQDNDSWRKVAIENEERGSDTDLPAQKDGAIMIC